jgi:hypothetical protein
MVLDNAIVVTLFYITIVPVMYLAGKTYEISNEHYTTTTKRGIIVSITLVVLGWLAILFPFIRKCCG